jgi:hypothetical protein
MRLGFLHSEKNRRLNVFENELLRNIFVLIREEVTERWRKVHSKELHNLYSSPNIIRVFKSRRVRWAAHLSYMEVI